MENGAVKIRSGGQITGNQIKRSGIRNCQIIPEVEQL